MATSMEFVEVGTVVVWTCRSSCRRKTPFTSACVDSVERSVLAICILLAKSAFSFTFGIARGATRQPPAATAVSFSLLALTGRAAVIDLLIVASPAAVDGNWRASAVKRSWRCVDVFVEVLFGDKAECWVWRSAIDEASVAFSCAAVIVALFRSLPVRGF